MHSQQPPQPPRRYGQQPPQRYPPQPPGDPYQQPGSPPYQRDLAPYQQQSPSPFPPRPSYQPTRLDSEEVVLAAPMSFTGSAERLWKLTRNAPANGLASAAVYAGVILLIAIAWAAVLFWYFFFWALACALADSGKTARSSLQARRTARRSAS